MTDSLRKKIMCSVVDKRYWSIIGHLHYRLPGNTSQVVVNNSCSELWEVHGFCYKCIKTGAHCLCVVLVKEDKTGTEES